jgi:Spy/CpxP family protein refolding chaperone
MKKSAKYIGILIVCMGACQLVLAQLPPNVPIKWWYNARMIKELELTQQQVQKIDGIWIENRKVLIGLRAEHDKVQVDLEDLIARPAVDEAALRSKVDQLYKAKADVEKATLLMRLKIRDILTPEQQEKSRSLFEQFRQEIQEKRNPGDSNDAPAGFRGVRPRNPLRVPPSTIPPQKPSGSSL